MGILLCCSGDEVSPYNKSIKYSFNKSFDSPQSRTVEGELKHIALTELKRDETAGECSDYAQN